MGFLLRESPKPVHSQHPEARSFPTCRPSQVMLDMATIGVLFGYITWLKNRGRFPVYLVVQSTARAVYFPKRTPMMVTLLRFFPAKDERSQQRRVCISCQHLARVFLGLRFKGHVLLPAGHQKDTQGRQNLGACSV